MLSTLGINFSRQHFEIFFLTFSRKKVLTFQILFSGKSKKTVINLSSELAQRVVEVNEPVYGYHVYPKYSDI